MCFLYIGFNKIIIYILCVVIFCLNVCLRTMPVPGVLVGKKRIRLSETGGTAVCEQWDRFWEVTAHPL